MILNRCTAGDDYGRALRIRRRVGLWLAMGTVGCLGLYALLYGAAYWRLSKKL